MKWKPLEPTQGQFTTAIPDAMIAWARAHNIRYRGNNNNNNIINPMVQCAGPQPAVGQAVEQPGVVVGAAGGAVQQRGLQPPRPDPGPLQQSG